jgi:hypothetical protein
MTTIKMLKPPLDLAAIRTRRTEATVSNIGAASKSFPRRRSFRRFSKRVFPGTLLSGRIRLAVEFLQLMGLLSR